jgi:hypothetical protein
MSYCKFFVNFFSVVPNIQSSVPDPDSLLLEPPESIIICTDPDPSVGKQNNKVKS